MSLKTLLENEKIKEEYENKKLEIQELKIERMKIIEQLKKEKSVDYLEILKKHYEKEGFEEFDDGEVRGVKNHFLTITIEDQEGKVELHYTTRSFVKKNFVIVKEVLWNTFITKTRNTNLPQVMEQISMEEEMKKVNAELNRLRHQVSYPNEIEFIYYFERYKFKSSSFKEMLVQIDKEYL